MKRLKLRKLFMICGLAVAGIFGATNICHQDFAKANAVSSVVDVGDVVDDSVASGVSRTVNGKKYQIVWFFVNGCWNPRDDWGTGAGWYFTSNYGFSIDTSDVQMKNKVWHLFGDSTETPGTADVYSEIHGAYLAKIFLAASLDVNYIYFAGDRTNNNNNCFVNHTLCTIQKGGVFIEETCYWTGQSSTYQLGTWTDFETLTTSYVKPIYFTSTNNTWWNPGSGKDDDYRNYEVWVHEYFDDNGSVSDDKYTWYPMERARLMKINGSNYVQWYIAKGNLRYVSELVFGYNGSSSTNYQKTNNLSVDTSTLFTTYAKPAVYVTTNYSSWNYKQELEWGMTSNCLVNYFDQGGSAFSGDNLASLYSNYTYGTGRASLISASKVGYDFGGFYLDSACSTTPVTTISTTDYGDITLYVKWTPKTYAVNLDRGPASTGSTSITATYDTAMPSTTMPEEYSYEFQGYYDATNGSGTKYYNADGTSACNWNKTTDNTTLYAYWKRQPGFYVIDYTGGTYADINTAVRQDEVTVGDNNVSWTNVTLTGDHDYRLVYIETNQSITIQDNHTFQGNYSNIGISHLSGTIDGFRVSNTGEYKIFYTSDWKTYINRDFTVTCKAVIGSVVTQVGQVTCNSDVNINSALGTTYSAYDVKGYYVNEECTSSIDVTTYCPSSNMTIFAKCEIQPTIANNKVRLWIGYDVDNPFYSYADNDSITLWIHKNPSDASAGERVYSIKSGTYNNGAEGYRRYDYFDVDIVVFEEGWYLSPQKIQNSTLKSQMVAIQLSSSNVGKVFYLWGDWAWDNFNKGTISPGAVKSCDALMAVWAMDGLHTCSSSVYNGYGAFDNYNNTFVMNGEEWRLVGNLSDHTVLDYADGDISYSGSATKVVNAYSKYQWLNYYAHGGDKPAYALGSFGLFGYLNDGNNTATILIIIASSISLLSITALSVLVIKKRKTK